MSVEAFAYKHELEPTQHLKAALTHSSMRRNGRVADPFQRLEFLGDRILGLIMADMLYNRFLNATEGALSQKLHALVRAETLANIARKIKLDEALLTDRNSQDISSNVLADALEAVIGAIYLCEGLESAKKFILHHWSSQLDNSENVAPDAKNALQEWAQARGFGLPIYECVDQDGPPHAPTFKIRVCIGDTKAEIGKGSSKREAEKQAAMILLATLKAENGKTK